MLIFHVDAHSHDDFVLTADLFFPVQNGAVTQKDTLNDDEFEPYLSTQARQVSFPPGDLMGHFLWINQNKPDIYLL